MRFDRLTAVCTSLETIFKEKYKDNKKIYLIVRHETLESCWRSGVRRYRLWVEIMNEDVDERDISVTGHIVQVQEEDTPRAYIMTEDEFEDLAFYNLEGKLITELIKYFYERIL